MIFIACILWMIPSQACSPPNLEDWPLIEELNRDMGDIECGQTVTGTTDGLGQPGNPDIIDNFWHVYRLLVQGDNCQIDISGCGEDTSSFFTAQSIAVFDSAQQLITEDVTQCTTGSISFNELLDVDLSSTTCSAYYIRIGGQEACYFGNYEITLSCTGCTSCVPEEEPVDCSLCDGSSESSESVDDAKAVSVQHDDGIFANMDDHDIVDHDQDESEKEVTLRIADKVWENIYGAIIVLMVCCGVFCFMFTKTNKRYV